MLRIAWLMRVALRHPQPRASTYSSVNAASLEQDVCRDVGTRVIVRLRAIRAYYCH